MNGKHCPVKVERLIELMISQVSEIERRRNPSLIKCERQMRETLRRLKDLSKEKSTAAACTIGKGSPEGGVQCG